MTDVLIVLVGGALSGITVLISSSVGLLIKSLGIDLVIWFIKNEKKGNFKQKRMN